VLKRSAAGLGFFSPADSPGVESASFFNPHWVMLGHRGLTLGVDSDYKFGPEGKNLC
jgi:hypothetical protein